MAFDTFQFEHLFGLLSQFVQIRVVTHPIDARRPSSLSPADQCKGEADVLGPHPDRPGCRAVDGIREDVRG